MTTAEVVGTDLKVVETRTFSVRDMSSLFELCRLMRKDKFTGRLVVCMSEGGINLVNTEQSKKLPT